ncbi:hypothetical protein RJ640_005081 [Escallonia rubra]|uniref:S-adenosyl-L-methionine-dependent methyltransferase superfamily protein n=1 Tax=Escallonia rubra TaxID=112253 RepID=A0AA88U7Z0_9ASTE|nr:hypothetical protein RJ640_005081 [Escallonia rubra]
MVYSGAVDRIIGRPPPKTGDVVLVADGTEKPIGWGLYNSVSMFCVRLMQQEEEASCDPSCALNVEKLLETRISAATMLRKKLGLPSANTNAYRLVNSEGDRLSGLVIDIFGDLAVIASSAAWVENYKPQIKSLVSKLDKITSISWRPSVEILKEEGLDFSGLSELQPSTCLERVKLPLCHHGAFVYKLQYLGALLMEDVAQKQRAFTVHEATPMAWIPCDSFCSSESLERVQHCKDLMWNAVILVVRNPPQVMENGISYMISLEGQKTGFFADQRENRQYISTISEGQKVLDMCCYTGGFALNAARGQAMNVTGVDTSLLALELANKNIVLNNLDPGRISFLKQDASAFMKDALSRNESWDIVIMDPPKLAPRKKVLHSATGMYRNLNSLAMRLTKRGGLLMTCSCSGAVTQSGTFLRILQARCRIHGW